MFVISDSPDPIDRMRVEQVFVKNAGIRNLSKIREMRRLVREFQPDVVHGHLLTVGGFYASVSGGRRIACSAVGPDVQDSTRKSMIERLLTRFVIRRCDLLFTVTRDSIGRFRNWGYRGDIEVVRFGVDAEKFRRYSRHGTDEFRILSFRYCSSSFNPLVVVSGFKKALPRIKNAYLYLVDSGDQIEEVHAMVDSDHELASHVRFFPKKIHDEMPEVYNSADVGISVTSSHGISSSVIEAMSCELPVIVADTPSMREIVEPSVTGHVTRITPDCVGDILIKAYAMRSLLPGMGKRARARVLDPADELTWESNMQAAEGAYLRLIRSRA